MPHAAITGTPDRTVRQASSFAAAVGGRFGSYMADLQEGGREPIRDVAVTVGA